MGSVIPYLNASWTAFTGMSLFVSKMRSHPLFSISENEWRSWWLQTVPSLGGLCLQEHLSHHADPCPRRIFSPCLSPLVPSRLLIGDSFSAPKLSLAHRWWPSEASAPRCAGPSGLVTSQIVPDPLPHWHWSGWVTVMTVWVRRQATGKASQGSRGSNVLPFSLFETTLECRFVERQCSTSSTRLKRHIIYVKKLLVLDTQHCSFWSLVVNWNF